MNDETDWMTALRAGLGGQKLLGLVDALGSIKAVLDAPAGRLKKAGVDDAGLQRLRRPEQEHLDRDARWLSGANHHLLPFGSPGYPDLLARIPSPPAVLFVSGDPGLLWRPQIGIVGSRNPTAAGLDHARAFAAELSRQGLTVTSGMARGVDTAAHEAALNAGGATVAVMGTGPDLIYPAAGAAVAGRIRETGALVTELPPGTQARRQHFPSRNRIISGLSLGVLVIEAGLNSGSLITARLAAEQGREAFALPGSLHNPMARGCHRLIKQGARLVESTADIMEELRPMAQELALTLRRRLAEDGAAAQGAPEPAAAALPEDAAYQGLWQALGFDPVTVDALVERSGLPSREVSSMLLILELKGLVEFLPGSRVSRRA